MYADGSQAPSRPGQNDRPPSIIYLFVNDDSVSYRSDLTRLLRSWYVLALLALPTCMCCPNDYVAAWWRRSNASAAGRFVSILLQVHIADPCVLSMTVRESVCIYIYTCVYIHVYTHTHISKIRFRDHHILATREVFL